MRSLFALGAGAALALVCLPTLVWAQYDGPYGGSEGPGPYGYGPPPGVGYGYSEGPRPRQAQARKPFKARGSVAYHGYRIGLSNAARSSAGAREAAAVEHQVDMVENAGLSAADRRLFRRTVIKSNRDAGIDRSHAGNDVTLGRINYQDSRPVLLHEFMHVYHKQRLPGGFRNPAIRQFYQEALANGLYPQGSNMMRNHLEFFAMTASAYLHGTVARPPYNRETIREAQPAYYAYLASLFGPR